VLDLREAGVTGVIGGTIVMSGVIAGLAVADAPVAFAAVVAFGLMGVLGAWVRLRGHWRARSLGMRLPPPARRLRAAAARPRWTTGELAALGDEDSLEQLLLATEARREGKFL